MEILEQTLKQMPRYFSSNEFSRKAQKKGMPLSAIQGGIISSYLTINADKGESRRMWYKRVEKNEPQKEIYFNKDNEIEKAIALLKSNGYKIMKQTIDFIEV